MKKTSLIQFLVFGLVFTMAACSDKADTITGTTTETTSTGETTPSENEGESATETNADGDDVSVEDGDCNDSDGTIFPGATEVVEDGLVDEDCDGFILQATETDCADAVDNDANGTIDCDDAACSALDDCAVVTTETSCTDGADNEATPDGLIDCLDSDCNADAACVAVVTETLCSDTLDDDGDTFIDCADSDCDADASCATSGETVTLSSTDFEYSYNPTDGSVVMRWVSESGSNFQADGVTANDCATVTTPCADIATAIANIVAPNEIVGVFEGTFSYTSDLAITTGLKIDGGYYWESDGVLAANPEEHAADLDFVGAIFAVNAPGKVVVVSGLNITGDHYPAVLRIINSSPVFTYCRIHARSGIVMGQAVEMSNSGTGAMRPVFVNSNLSVGNITSYSTSNAEAVVINAENSSTGTLNLTLRNNRITVGRVVASSASSTSKGVVIQGNSTGVTFLTMWKNNLSLDMAQTSTAVSGDDVSRVSIQGNSITVKGGDTLSTSTGISMDSLATAVETLNITGNLIALHRAAPVAQNSNIGINATEFATTITGNTIVLGPASFSTGILVDNLGSVQDLEVRHNFLQSDATTAGTTMLKLTMPSSAMAVNISYNGYHLGSGGGNIFSDTMAVYSSASAQDDATAGLLVTYASTYTGTVTGNLDITSDPLTWLGARVILDTTTGAALIDKGDSTLAVPATARDVNDKPRLVDGDNADGDSDPTTGAIIDIGAVESQP